MRATVQLLLLALLATSQASRTIAQASGVLSEGELASIIRARLGSGHQSSLAALVEAARTLPDLGAELKDAACKRAAAALGAGDAAAAETVAAIEAAARLRCLDAGAAKAASELLLTRFRACDTVAELARLARAKRALHDAYGKAPLPAEVAQSLTRLLADATAPSGKVRNKSGAGIAIQSTGAAYQAVADLTAVGAIKGSAEAAEKLRSQAPKVLEGASAGGLHAAGDADGLAAVAALLQGARALQLTSLPHDKLEQLATYAAKFKAVGSAGEALSLLAAKQALRELGAAGVAFAVRTPSVRLGSQEAVRVDATDAFGNAIDLSGITAALLPKSGKPTALPVSAAADHVSLDLLSQATRAGPHTVQLSDASGAVGRFVVSVTEAPRYGTARVTVEREDGSSAGEHTVEHPQALAQAVAASAGSTVQVSIETDEATVLPVLLLQCDASGEAVAAGFKREGSEAKATLELKAVLPHFQSECTQLELVARHTAAAGEGGDWALATLAVSGERPAAPTPAWQAEFAPKPTISHQFRRPDKRPPAAISLAFAGAAVLPLGLLLVGLQRTGVNLKDLPRSGSYAAAALVFHGGLAGLALLYTAFWVHLNLLETLPLLALLSVVLFLSGHVLLSHRSAVRSLKAP